MHHRPGRPLRCILVCAALAGLHWAPAAADIHVQPYLQNPQPDGVTILWWTDGSQPASQVEYGQGDFDSVVAATNQSVGIMGKYLHQATLSGLAQEAEYDYRVRSGGLVSRAYAFRTAVAPGSDVHVAVLGDGRTDDATIIAAHRAVLTQAAVHDPDVVFELGDMVYEGTAADWDALYRRIVTDSDPADPGTDLGSFVPYLTCVGNHDICDGTWGGGLTTSMALFKAYAAHPPNGSANPHWEERYYVLRSGCATFIVLDTNNTSDDALDNHDELPDGSTPDWEPGSEQHTWMLAQLQQAEADSVFTFVLFHPSPYSRGIHGTPDPATDYQRGYELRVLDPVFRHYGVDAVLSSHDHHVERCLTGPHGFEAAMDVGEPANLNWLVQGNSGEGARPAWEGWETWMDVQGTDAAPFYTVWFYDWGGTGERSFLDVDITYEGGGLWRAHFATIQADGDRHDEFDLFRTEGLPHAPAAVAASDGAHADKVAVTWDPAWAATGYEVWRAESDDPADASRIAESLVATRFDDTTAVPGVTYWYWVMGTNEHGDGPLSVADYGHCRGLGPLTIHVDDDNVSGVVNGTAPWPFDTIQAAIDAAADGDTVLVHDGTYTGDGNRDVDFHAKAVTVTSGNGPQNCIIDCQGSEQDPHRGFRFHSDETPDAIVQGFTITNGWAPAEFGKEEGGGIFCYQSSPTLRDNVITNCHASYTGGGLWLLRCELDVPVENNVLAGNTAGERGGGIECTSSTAAIVNCTLCGNRASEEGGGLYAGNSDVTVTNCIVWGNTASDGAPLAVAGSGGTLSVAHCDVEGGEAAVFVDAGCTLNWGNGNIDGDPLFVDPGRWDGDTWVEGDCHLQNGSPCINAGDNAAVEPGETDMDGEARIQHLVADMGADETGSVGAPDPPGPAELDDEAFAGLRLNPTGPAAHSGTLESLGTGANPPGTLYAIQVGSDPNGGWLYLAADGGRTDVSIDGAAPEWHTAGEWAGRRVRGLQPETTYEFSATCRTPPGAGAPVWGAPRRLLAGIGSFTTSKACDVDRSERVTARDYGCIRSAILRGHTAGQGVCWPCDADGDGDVDGEDLAAARDAAMSW